MKTTFRKEFNSFEDDFNIEETTVNEDLGIDPVVIKNNVLGQISTGKKRKNRKGFTVFLIAAAVSATVLGTTAIAATISKNRKADFTEKFDGEVSILEVKEAVDFSFEPADQNLQAEFLGIVSDGDKAVASVILTKKDGSAFVDEGMNILKPEGIILDDIQPLKYFYGLEDKNYLSALRNMENKPDYQYVFYSTDRRDNIVEENTDNVEYILSDDRTELKMYIELCANYGTVSGGRGEISSEYFNACKYTNTIAEYPIMNEDNYFRAKTLSESKDLDFYKDCKWVFNDGVYTLYQIEPVRYDLVYDMSFKMDFEVNNTIKSVFTERQAPDFLRNNSVMNMKMTSFKLSLNSAASYTEDEVRTKIDEYCKMNDYTEEMMKNIKIDIPNNNIEPLFAVSSTIYNYVDDKFRNIDFSKSKIIMKDGKEFYLIDTNNGMGYSQDDSGRLNVTDDLEFAFSERPYYNGMGYGLIENDVRKAVVDPQKVSSIVINGNTIYKAPDERTNTTRNAELDTPCKTDVKNRQINPFDEKYFRDFIFGTKSGLVDNGILQDYDIYEVFDFENEEGVDAVTYAILTLKGTKNQLLNIVNNVVRDEENGLIPYGVSITDKPDSFDEYTMELSLKNYYLKKGSELDENAALQKLAGWFKGSELYNDVEKHFMGGITNNVEIVYTQPDHINLGFELNSYERNNGIFKMLSHDDAPSIVKEKHRVSMNITPSKVLLSSEDTASEKLKENDINFLSMEEPEHYDYSNSKVTMKDGTEYYLIFGFEHEQVNYGFGRADRAEENAKSDPTVKTAVVFAYSQKPLDSYNMTSQEIYDNAVKVVPSDISSITLNGSTIYEAE